MNKNGKSLKTLLFNKGLYSRSIFLNNLAKNAKTKIQKSEAKKQKNHDVSFVESSRLFRR